MAGCWKAGGGEVRLHEDADGGHHLPVPKSVGISFSSGQETGPVLADCVGAALQKRSSPSSPWQLLAFFSKKMEPAQVRYSPFDQELLASCAGIHHFQYMLEGRPFTIYTCARGKVTDGWIAIRVQWFWLFSHFEVQPPIPDTQRAQGFGNWQKKFFNFIHGLRKFLAKTRKCVFLV